MCSRCNSIQRAATTGTSNHLTKSPRKRDQVVTSKNNIRKNQIPAFAGISVSGGIISVSLLRLRDLRAARRRLSRRHDRRQLRQRAWRTATGRLRLAGAFQDRARCGLLAGDDREQNAGREERRSQKGRDARQKVGRAASGHETAAALANAKRAAFRALNKHDPDKGRGDHEVDYENYRRHLVSFE